MKENTMLCLYFTKLIFFKSKGPILSELDLFLAWDLFFIGIYLALFMSSTLAILSHHFSPILHRHHLKNVCSILVIVLVFLYVSDPCSSIDYPLMLNILRLVADFISVDFNKFLSVMKSLFIYSLLLYYYFNISVSPK